MTPSVIQLIAALGGFWKYWKSWLVDKECQQPLDTDHFKTYRLSLLCSWTPCFLPLADQSYVGCQCGCQPDRFILWNHSCYLHWGKSSRKPSYFNPTKHLPAVMEERPQSFSQQSGKYIFFFSEDTKYSLLSPASTSYCIDVHLCDGSQLAHRREHCRQ